MAQLGSSFRHQRNDRSASSNQNECNSAFPWLNHRCTSGFFVVIGNGVSPIPLMTQGRVRIPESNADPCPECPGSSSKRAIGRWERTIAATVRLIMRTTDDLE